MRIPGLVLASLIASAPLAAQSVEMWAGAVTGMELQGQDDRGAKDAATFGVTGGAWFNSHWGMDASFRTANIESSRGQGSGNQQYLTTGALFNFLPGNKFWKIYAKAGVGSVNIQPPWSGSSSSTTKTVTLIGAGTQYRIGLTGFAGIELQLMRFDADYHEWPVLISAGWRFGVGK